VCSPRRRARTSRARHLPVAGPAAGASTAPGGGLPEPSLSAVRAGTHQRNGANTPWPGYPARPPRAPPGGADLRREWMNRY
jgi:hypothetical protein